MSELFPIRVEWLGVDPMAAPRPRYGRDHTYMPTDYVNYRDALAWMMVEARAKASHQEPFGDPVGINVSFALSSSRRIDIDNLLKTVLDAMNGGVLLTDDSLVLRVYAELARGVDLPGTVLEVYPLERKQDALSVPKASKKPRGTSGQKRAETPAAIENGPGMTLPEEA